MFRCRQVLVGMTNRRIRNLALYVEQHPTRSHLDPKRQDNFVSVITACFHCHTRCKETVAAAPCPSRKKITPRVPVGAIGSNRMETTEERREHAASDMTHAGQAVHVDKHEQSPPDFAVSPCSPTSHLSPVSSYSLTQIMEPFNYAEGIS